MNIIIGHIEHACSLIIGRKLRLYLILVARPEKNADGFVRGMRQDQAANVNSSGSCRYTTFAKRNLTASA